MRTMEQLLKDGLIDGQNAQARFFGIKNIPCTPDGMSEEELDWYLRTKYKLGKAVKR